MSSYTRARAGEKCNKRGEKEGPRVDVLLGEGGESRPTNKKKGGGGKDLDTN